MGTARGQGSTLLEQQFEAPGKGNGLKTGASTDRRQLEEILSPGTARVLAIGLGVFIGIKLAFLVYLGWNTQYIMDEYWLAGHSQLLSANPYQDFWPAKPLLYACFFWIANELGSNTVEVMHLARVETLVLAFGGLGILYGIARNVGLDRLESMLSLAVVLGFSSYMERIFMIRPEPLSLFVTLIALYLVTRGRDSLRIYLIAGLLCGVAFLCSQKAVYFNLALGLALVGDWLLRGSFRRAVVSGAILVAGWAIAILVYALYFWFQGAEYGAVVGQGIDGSTSNALYGHLVYGDALKDFLILTFARNAPLYALAILAWLIMVPRLRVMSPPERMAWIFTGTIFALVYLHKAPWPYNFIMAIPFLGIWGARCFVQFAALFPQSASLALRVAAFMIPLWAVLLLSFGRNVVYLANGNHLQNLKVTVAESMLSPTDTYADGTGMIVTRQRAGDEQWWAKGPLTQIRALAEKGDYSMIETVLADQPKLWIHTYRTFRIWDILTPYFEHSYLSIEPNIFVTGSLLAPDRVTQFRNRWQGRYSLFHANGQEVREAVKIDGIATHPPFDLPLGTYRIGPVAGDTELFLLPSDLEGPFAITPPEAHKVLFNNVHRF